MKTITATRKLRQGREYTNFGVIWAKATALAEAAKNNDAGMTNLCLRDLDALMPYFRQDVLHHTFNDRVAEALRRE